MTAIRSAFFSALGAAMDERTPKGRPSVRLLPDAATVHHAPGDADVVKAAFKTARAHCPAGSVPPVMTGRPLTLTVIPDADVAPGTIRATVDDGCGGEVSKTAEWVGLEPMLPKRRSP